MARKPIELEPVDWKKTISELTQSLTLEGIASLTGISKSALGDLSTGRSQEPKHGAGARILALLGRERAKISREINSEANRSERAS